MELKKINWSDKVFEANGKKYFITTSISISRAIYLEEARIELETGVRIGKTTEGLLTVYDHLQKGKFADAAVECYNRISAVDRFFERPLPVLRICSCFINAEGEDLRIMTDEMAAAKVEDWKSEAISMESFFALALTFIVEETAGLPKFTERFSNVVQQFATKSAQQELNTTILD